MTTSESNEEKGILKEDPIDDDKFYEILEKASGKPAESIKAVIHDTNAFNTEEFLKAHIPFKKINELLGE